MPYKTLFEVCALGHNTARAAGGSDAAQDLVTGPQGFDFGALRLEF